MSAIVRVLLMVLITGSVVDAQIMQAVNRFANPGESEKKTNEAVANDADDKGAVLLSQASAQTTSDGKTQIALQAVDLWMSRKSRLYARLTLPVKTEPAAASAPGAAPTEPAVKPSDGVVKQLVDPFGGVFNLSGGIFTRLGVRSKLTRQEIDTRDELLAKIPAKVEVTGEKATALVAALKQTLGNRALGPDDFPAISKAALATAKVGDNPPTEKLAGEIESVYQKVAKMQPDHGAFLDVRGGLKMIDLPGPGERAVGLGGDKVNVFYTGVAGLKVITPLSNRALNPGEQSREDIAGGVTLGAYLVGNHAADAKQSSLFATALNKKTLAFTAVVGVNIANVAALTFSLTPWTSDHRLGKVFVFGFDMLRPTKDEAKK